MSPFRALIQFCLPLVLAVTVICGPAVLGAEKSDRLTVLFLGDGGHHRPAERAAQLIPVMVGRGIDITYSEQSADLNPKNLAKYDALIIYANTEKIEPREEKALLDYVAGGGGFVPLHCASYCFLNSPKYIALVGAQFQRHGTGEFDTKTIVADHPVTKDLAPFHTWDETYVHHLHNEKDRTVLQVRAEGDREEPWTWVRNEGKGRVFYTAYGHDERTWSNPGFHALVERGIRWAANKGEVFDSTVRPRKDVKPFEYVKAKLPNYLAGKNWGAQGEPISQMQTPLDPAESAKHMVTPRGFETQLFAAEPDIAKPIAMAWDHRGRLWIAETVDYPNNRQPAGEGHDRIKICEDTDGDGRADKFTVFADKLSIPTSLLPVAGGVIVHQAPHTLLLRDTDGDDKADERKVLLDGWNTSDTHAGPSNLRYGFDNWIWSMVGYAGFKGTVGGEQQQFQTGFFRFKPDGSKLEFLRNTNNNSWGVGFSEEGLIFGSTANGNPSVYLPIPNRYYEAVRGWSASVLGNTAASAQFYPITDKVRQVDHHGSFTAASGHALYTARTYPRSYWNRTAFVSDGTGHLTATFLLEPRGSDFISTNAWNLVASDDEWSSPIVAEVGPDGNMWVIDWYNYIVQHNPTPQGFETGKGNAYVTPVRDKTHGRIYRVVPTGAKPSAIAKLDPNNAEQLVAALASDNLFWRSTAQRLLVERGKPDVQASLIKLIDTAPTDSIGLCPGAIHALWTLDGLGLVEDKNSATTAAVVAALKHSTPGVRRNALGVLSRSEASLAALLNSGVLADSDAQVRLAALLALAEMPTSKQAASPLVAAVNDSTNLKDRWIPEAATAAAARHAGPFLTALAERKDTQPLATRAGELATRVAEHYARSAPVDSVASLVAALAKSETSTTTAVVAGLAKGWPKDRAPKLTAENDQALVALLPKLSPAGKGQLVNLANRWNSKGFEKYSAEIADSFLSTVRDEQQSQESRVDAAKQLIEFRKSDLEAAKNLLALVTPKSAPELATGLIAAVAQSEATDAGTALVETLATSTPTVRPLLIQTLLRRADWTEDFLVAAESGKIQLAELSLDQKQGLANHPTKSIAQRAKKLLASGGGLPNPDRQKVIDEISPLVLRTADAAKGKVTFKAQCAKCHMHSGEGNKIGPDLTGMAAHPKAELLIHLLDPSRGVEGNFRQYSAVIDDGRIINGLLVAETKTSIEMVDAENKKHVILRENLDELIASTKSLMPEGFEKQVPADDIANLLEFLTQRGKYLPLDLRKVATVVSTKGMFYSEDSDAERLIFPDWSPKTFEGVPFQLVDPRDNRVPNVVMLYGPQGKTPPRMPKSVELPCNTPAKAIHLLSGVSGWGALGSDAKQTVSMIVRLHYHSGATEDHELKNGIHFADYIRQFDVPESKLAFKLRGQQIRYLAIFPQQTESIDRIELVKGPDHTAPVVMAVTVETRQ